MQIVTFIDTNVLLKGFAADRVDGNVPICLSDPDAKRYTFEKCLFEAYLAFRGVGGKKPDEGRGRWAESHLKNVNDPFPLGKLSSKHHDGNTQIACFWINNIDSLRYGGLEDFKDSIERFVRLENKEEAYRGLAQLRELVEQRNRYDLLCDQFREFLERRNVSVLSYGVIFGQENLPESGAPSDVHPARMDTLVRDTAIPSEDFEIVFAALRLTPDLFVTDDERLINAVWSLGLNLPLSADAFCTSNGYSDRAERCRKEMIRTERRD